MISPDQAVSEMLAFNQKLGQGLQTLAEMKDVRVGESPKEAVYQEDKLTLYRYQNTCSHLNPTPLLIVYALVNRPYMLDLQPDRSTIRGLLEMGQDVYLIDWGYPDGSDRFLTLDDYINGYIHRCVKTICRRHNVDKVNLLGVCQGGTFSLCYSALHPECVHNLMVMVTPVDFKTEDNLLSHWMQQLDVDLLVDTLGNVPGDLLNWTFLSMKPFRLSGQKYIDMLDNLHDSRTTENFLRMEKWIFDSPHQAGEAFRQFAKALYQENKLIKNQLCLGGQRVELRNLTMPILNIYAMQDHIVPPSASKVLAQYIETEDYTELPFDSGHIGIYVSSRAQREVPTTIGQWLSQRIEPVKSV